MAYLAPGGTSVREFHLPVYSPGQDLDIGESLPDDVESQLLLSYHGSTHVEKEQPVEGVDDTEKRDHHVERFFQMAAGNGETMVRRRAVWATGEELEELVTQVTAGWDDCIGARVQYSPEGLGVPLGVSPGDTA
ncbi:hypothetical protein EHS25_008248 [Saitozyma podzolica]|uniref:Uncharacterized protein n=1 Tax=Saitozyma podzolica TaxID=1890683 RepID=A0A427YNU6_9TREE|nr:hypothetical protein EHS25_008248 [Saitozyma podzolica]